MTTSCEALRGALGARGVNWDAPIHCLDHVDSTSSWLVERERRGAPSWTVVTARDQSAGRGRRGRHWASPPGGLFLSVLCPAPAPADLGLVGLLAGTATARAVAGFVRDADVRVKWPNDVLLDGRKVAGILAEGCARRGQVRRIVVGIGVNVASAPSLDEGSLPATSMGLAGRPHALENVAAAVLADLRLCYDALLRGEAQQVTRDWRALSVAWWGSLVSVRDGETRITGRALDVDEQGRLIVETETGGRRTLSSGDVTQVRPSGGGYDAGA